MGANPKNVRGRSAMRLAFHPATPERWGDLEKLFGARGACAGCWCMFYRLPRRQWTAQSGTKNKSALNALVASGVPPGILAYAGGEAVGWCAVAPRADYPRLAKSRILAPVDDQPVWSITCLFVARSHRRAGVSSALVAAAAEFAASQGARIVEGYPVEPQKDSVPDTFVWNGLASSYRKSAFKEVARRSPTRPIMRRDVRVRSRRTNAP